MADFVSLTPEELRGILRVAEAAGDLSIARADGLVEVVTGDDICGQPMLFVGPPAGTVYRIADDFEKAARPGELYRTNLLPVTDEDLRGE